MESTEEETWMEIAQEILCLPSESDDGYFIFMNEDHDKIVEEIADRLKRQGYLVDTFFEYKCGDLSGEMDIYARLNGTHQYHEVKCKNTPELYQKAREQFQRVRKAYPTLHWEFFYHTPGQAMRVSL